VDLVADVETVDTEPREPRARLTRDRVLRAAMELADEGGIEALTMRRLARVLGVEAMSLYYHAANKDDILAGIVDLVVREIELPSPAGDWKSALRASAISAHQVLRRHPWACNLLMSGPRVSPARLRQIDAVLARLDEAGLPDELTDLGYHALDSHILGFTLWEAGYTIGLKDMPADLATVVRELHLEDYPNLLAHAAYHQRPRRPGQKGEFEFGLDLILDGLEVSRDPARPAARAETRLPGAG
jgi:AcrR family transcriptional regulator